MPRVLPNLYHSILMLCQNNPRGKLESYEGEKWWIVLTDFVKHGTKL